MTKRIRYRVPPTDGGDWKVVKKGSTRASAVEQNSQVAIERAIQLSKKAPHGQIGIHKKGGLFRTQEECIM